MEFVVNFSFINRGSDALQAKLTLSDSSFSLDRAAQLKSPYMNQATPPLEFVSIDSGSFSITAGNQSGSDQQSIQITLEVKINGQSIDGSLQIPDGVDASYSFLGYAQRGSLPLGPFSIPLPSA